MTNNSRGNAGDVFGGAARASQYVEEDTQAVPVRRRQEQPEVMIEPPAEIEAETKAVTDVAAAPRDESPAATENTSAGERVFGAETTSLLFGGSPAESTVHDPAKATTGFRGVLASMGLPIKPGAAELATRQQEARRSSDETVVRQATWTRAVSILVNNPKGGTGKTPTALLLAGAIASLRGGSTCVLEVSDDPGALAYRAEGKPRLGLGELVRDIDQVTTAGRLKGYTAPQTSFADVIGSTGRRERLTGEAVVAVSNVIDEFYGIRVMDSGNQPTSSAFQGAVSVSDLLVIPVVNAGDSVLEAIQLLEELHAAGGPARSLANQAMAIRLTDGRPENQAVTDEVTRLLYDAGVKSLHEIPYDSHIAERGQLTFSRLNPATRDAFVAAAAAAVSSLQTTVSAEN